MVVNRNETVAPLFWYLYRPHAYGRRNAARADGGFNVALYPDHTLVYCTFNGEGVMTGCNTFQLPAEVTGRYMMILDSQSWWMGKLPRNICVDGDRPASTSRFGFTEKHPLFSCQDINTLVQAPFNSERGMYARRLRVMLECLSEMLFQYGIDLSVNSFSWNWQYTCPLEHMTEHAAAAMQAAQQNWQYADPQQQGWQYAAAQQQPQQDWQYADPQQQPQQAWQYAEPQQQGWQYAAPQQPQTWYTGDQGRMAQ